MLKKLLESLQGNTEELLKESAIFYKPYEEHSTNLIYNLLFCDDLAFFEDGRLAGVESPFHPLYKAAGDVEALRRIADDETLESRVRVMGYNLLRSRGVRIGVQTLLGTIVEQRGEEGLETLAVYTDGRCRYIDGRGRLLVIEESPEEIKAKSVELLQAAWETVEQIGPWDKQRLAPPEKGEIRMTFLVSDGLYFGQGALEVMEGDPLGARLIRAGRELEKLIVDCARR